MNIFGKMLTPSRILVVGFALVILFGTLLLTLPQATRDGLGLPFLNPAYYRWAQKF